MKQLTQSELDARKKTNIKILKFFIPIIGILLIILIIGTCSQEDKPKTKAEIEQIKKDSIIEVRSQKIDVILIGMEQIAKDKMRDPDSYELIEKTFDRNDTANIAKLLLKFRGNNAFGGKAITTILAKYDIKKDYLKITDQFNE